MSTSKQPVITFSDHNKYNLTNSEVFYFAIVKNLKLHGIYDVIGFDKTVAEYPAYLMAMNATNKKLLVAATLAVRTNIIHTTSPIQKFSTSQ
jgi:hypothetical protein